MDLTVKQEHFSKAFNNVSKIASSKTSLPILNNVLLRTNGSRLLIAATDLEIAISQNIGAKIESVGEIAVPARLVSEFISNLPKENVHIKVVGEDVFIESGNYKSKIKGIFTEDFPELPSVEEKSAQKITLKVDDFRTAVSQTIFTASTDTSRPTLTGVFWHTFEGNLYLAATDGYRLSEKRVCPINEEISAIISASSLNEVMRAISDNTEEIEILFDENQVEFHIDDMMIVARLIDGKFVDYRRLIPSDTETKVDILKADFMRVVKIASLFARESGESVTLRADGDNSKLSIHSIASEFGENTSEADAEIFGDGEVTLNPNFLIKGISAISSQDLQFGFSGKLAPTVLKNPADDSYIHIIMPLKS
ncbi:MAG: DNA polymerase III subunit beta [bacterium]|nr:DNA polymerase III subunit beta [bacterium]